MTRSRTDQMAHIDVDLGRGVPDTARAEAQRCISDLARYARDPILHARVRLTHAGDPAIPRPFVAQANLDVGGRPVRAQVAAKTAAESLDRLKDTLRERLARVARDWETRRGAQPVAEAGEWRHSREPADRPEYFPRPPEEREVVRHKSYELSRATPDEAVFDMDMMDYEFHLFTDLDTGQDSVVYHAGPTGHRLAQVEPTPMPERPSAVALSVSTRAAPGLTQAEAIERLNVTGLPFLFYADEASGRGRVLYRRYDGHYGLITPANRG